MDRCGLRALYGWHSCSMEIIEEIPLTWLVDIFELVIHALQALEECHIPGKILRPLETNLFPQSQFRYDTHLWRLGQLFSFHAKFPRILSLTFWDNFWKIILKLFQIIFILILMSFNLSRIKILDSLLPLDRLLQIYFTSQSIYSLLKGLQGFKISPLKIFKPLFHFVSNVLLTWSIQFA